jgi:hypothetical protein
MLVVHEEAAERRPHAEHVEIVGADHLPEDGRPFPTGREGQ